MEELGGYKVKGVGIGKDVEVLPAVVGFEGSLVAIFWYCREMMG